MSDYTYKPSEAFLNKFYYPIELQPIEEFEDELFAYGSDMQAAHEGKRLYWIDWHKHNTKKEQIYIKKGFSKAERKARSERAKIRNKQMEGVANGRARGVYAGTKYFGTVNDCAQYFDVTPHTVRNRIRSDKHDYRYANS